MASSKLQPDMKALIFGTSALVALFSVMMAAGYARGWNVQDASKLFDFYVVEDPTRFAPEPAGSSAAGSHYYWKLPPSKVNALTRAVVWLLYIAHQLAVWAVLYRAQLQAPEYASSLRAFNWQALAVNGVFHLLHFAQTHWTYDALAQDVHIASSQGSVILLLLLVLMMEYRDRGLVFGVAPKPEAKFRVVPRSAMLLVRKYHGYMFAWGAIYTFWYHPMESMAGHFLGFMHTGIIMLQGSLMYTRAHLNKYWRFTLEFWVTIHAAVVAFSQKRPGSSGASMWPMFVFGFMFIATLTQIPGLPVLKKRPVWLRALPFIAYIAVVLSLYGTVIQNTDGSPPPSWPRLQEPIRIPLIEYILTVLLAFVLAGMITVSERILGARGSLNAVAAIVVFLLAYTVNVAVSIAFEAASLQLQLFILAAVLVIIFGVFSFVGMLVLEWSMKKPVPPSNDADEERAV